MRPGLRALAVDDPETMMAVLRKTCRHEQKTMADLLVLLEVHLWREGRGSNGAAA